MNKLVAGIGPLNGFNKRWSGWLQSKPRFSSDYPREMKPPFGRELEETVAVIRVLEAAKEPLNIE